MNMHAWLDVLFLVNCILAGRQRFYLILLCVPMCLYNRWVQLSNVFQNKTSCVLSAFICKLLSVIKIIANRRRACSRHFGPQGRSLSMLRAAIDLSRRDAPNNVTELCQGYTYSSVKLRITSCQQIWDQVQTQRSKRSSRSQVKGSLSWLLLVAQCSTVYQNPGQENCCVIPLYDVRCTTLKPTDLRACVACHFLMGVVDDRILLYWF